MPYLLDINVLIALAWPNHIHHKLALQWFKKAREDGWATCPVTQSSFVRISSNQRIIPEARSPQAAMEALEKIILIKGHQFLSDDVSILAAPEICRPKIFGHNQVTDAHLLALAIRHDHCLATLDQGVRQLVTAAQAERSVRWIEPLQNPEGRPPQIG